MGVLLQTSKKISLLFDKARLQVFICRVCPLQLLEKVVFWRSSVRFQTHGSSISDRWKCLLIDSSNISIVLSKGDSQSFELGFAQLYICSRRI